VGGGAGQGGQKMRIVKALGAKEKENHRRTRAVKASRPENWNIPHRGGKEREFMLGEQRKTEVSPMDAARITGGRKNKRREKGFYHGQMESQAPYSKIATPRKHARRAKANF